MTVRRLRPDEWPLLRALRLAALLDAPEAFAATLTDALSSTDDDWRAWAEIGASGPDAAVFVAHDGDHPAGLVAGRREDADVHLLSLWVVASLRGRGHGGALVDAVVDWARELGAASVSLWVVEGNEPARRRYRRAGFRPTGRTQPLPSRPDLTEERWVRFLEA